MNHVFKDGASVHIYLADGKEINGQDAYASEQYVHLLEKRPDRKQPLDVYVNYSHISHVYTG